ncbi:uncharacterized protein LOC127850324 [Dreissena polymorpha]|uniref:uncharacterized protein LOC127850324 n=1 Tax=Dreissena polymorpha TaxID=45954 RepID=UPI002265144A|nr:uncharacterized protein LOC127850324 [Dreissena polymorpha]
MYFVYLLDEDTIRYLVSQTVDGEQDSDLSDVPATEDQSVDASSLDSRTADSGAATASASGVRWTHEGLLLMLSLYEEHKLKFDSASFKNKNVWRLKAEEMAHKGITVTGEACDSKFRLMKFKDKKIVDQHATSGSGGKSWEYFQRMDELFAGDPSVRPAMVVSSMPGSFLFLYLLL